MELASLTTHPITPEKEQQFAHFYTLLTTWNERFNLTTITAEGEVYEKHFADSIAGAPYMKGAVCDVGAGAGFPSIPLAILGAGDRFTLIDSVQKKVGYLKEVSAELGLQQVTAVHMRAEEAGRSALRESFDTVTARAVAALPTLLEYLAPLAKIGGKVVVYKTDSKEAETATNAAGILGLRLEETVLYRTGDAGRCLLIYGKVKATPKSYPRLGNKPRLNPIQ